MTILRVGCYERVSTDEQALRGFSIETQIDNLTEFCEKEGLKLVGHYTDEGVSGAKPPLKRPALQRLLEDVQAGKIDMILFTKLDRWFRSVKEYFKVQDILDRYKVEWRAIHEDYDTTTANGRMAITIFLAIAQNERDKASERVKAVFEHKIKNKEACFGGDRAPFGYMRQKDEDGIYRLVKNPEEEQMCSEFWKVLSEHERMNIAIRHMKEKFGITKDPTTWLHIVRKTFYCGMYDGVEGFCEPYVSKAEWEKIQAVADARKNDSSPKYTYMFSGLMRCPLCGASMASSTQKKVYKTVTTEYRHYRCRYRNTKCTYKRTLTEIQAEKQLLEKLPELIQNEIVSLEHEAIQRKVKPKYNLPALREKLRTLNASYMAGNKSDEEYVKEGAEIKALIAKAEQEAPPVERDLSPLKKLLDGDFNTIYSSLTQEEKRDFWRNILQEIKIEDNKIVDVVFRY